MNAEICPREQMSRLPKPLQPMLTWLTGKAHRAQKSPGRTHVFQAVAPVISIVLGVSAAYLALQIAGPALMLLPIGWLLVVSGARKLQVMIIHQCSHGTFTASRKLNLWTGRLLSMALFTENFDDYKTGHIGFHHSKKHMSEDDPTVKFVRRHLIHRPVHSLSELRLRLLSTLVSPSYHWEFFKSRFSSQMRAPSFWKGSGVLFWSGLLTLAFAGHFMTVLLAGAVVPLFLLYPVSSCLRLCIEHRWPAGGERPAGAREIQSEFSVGIFMGRPMPAGRGIVAHARWWAAMLTKHLFFRMFVMVGDTPCHDYHHRYPNSKDWVNYSYARQKDIETGHSNWPAYADCWGFGHALNEALSSIVEYQKGRTPCRTQTVS
jgi:fatty acid desaturase